jgi:hypothetical protein
LYFVFFCFYLKKGQQKNLKYNYNDENLFFLPAATSMIYEMGLESQLVGVTFDATRINQKFVPILKVPITQAK